MHQLALVIIYISFIFRKMWEVPLEALVAMSMLTTKNSFYDTKMSSSLCGRESIWNRVEMAQHQYDYAYIENNCYDDSCGNTVFCINV